jgi:hypothetical protein
VHGSINLITKELNVNYTHDRMKQIMVYKFLVVKQRIVISGWD